MPVAKKAKKKKTTKKKPAPASGGSKKKKKAKRAASGSKDGTADFNAKGLGKAWNEAREGGGFEDTALEPGDYVGKITSARVGNTQKDKNPYFSLNFTITRGDTKGATVGAYYGLHNAGAQKVLVGQLQALGFDTKKLDPQDLPEVAKMISKDKADVRLQVKHTVDEGRTFQNVYIRGLVDN